MSINHVTLSGNITKQPELKMGSSGSILPFSIAVNRRVKDASGKWVDQASFFDCVLFGTRAEKIAQYLNKGTKVSISGRLNKNKWQTREGENRYSTNVVVEELEFMSRGNAQAVPAAPAPAPAPVQAASQAPQVTVTQAAPASPVVVAEPQEVQVVGAAQAELYNDLPL